MRIGPARNSTFEVFNYYYSLHHLYSLPYSTDIYGVPIYEVERLIEEVVYKDFDIDYVKTLSEEEQVVYTYKWLTAYCNYNVCSAYSHTVYSVFVLRNSSAFGLSAAAKYLFNLLGIKSDLVFGHLDEYDIEHCWNVVKVNGRSYHFDVWYRSAVAGRIIDGRCRFVGDNGLDPDYMFLSTEDISKTRSIESKDLYSLCDHTLPVVSWLKRVVEINSRHGVVGVLLQQLDRNTRVLSCSKDKDVVFKSFADKHDCEREYDIMRKMSGCPHVLNCNKEYTDINGHKIIAIERATPVVDLLCSPNYEISLRGLIFMAMNVSDAWLECRNRGVFYRDIHIGNIFRSDDGIFKLGNFESCSQHDMSGLNIGNGWFMAPETIADGSFTEASAVYSIAMVMYVILNRLQPASWQNYEKWSVDMREMRIQLPSMAGYIPPDINEKLSAFFDKSLAFDSRRRISDVLKLRVELYILFNHIEWHGRDINIKVAEREYHPRITEVKEDWNSIRRGYISDYLYPATRLKEPTSGPVAVNDTGFEHSHIVPNLYETIVDSKITYDPAITTHSRPKTSFWNNLFQKNKAQQIFSSIYAPAEVRRESYMLIQVYLHSDDDLEKVKFLAKEPDKNAERRDYMPLSLMLKVGDKVEVACHVSGNEQLMSERKSVIWQGGLTKCSFSCLVPENTITDNLCCEVNIVVNGLMIGDMRFLTQIVERPRNLIPEIRSHQFKKIFISYAHKDRSRAKLIARAYRALGVDYFFDRDSLVAGDVFNEKILNYIDQADLFVLCWSRNAAASAFVCKEKERALQHAYPQVDRNVATITICIFSIEPRAELPSDMKDIYNIEKI